MAMEELIAIPVSEYERLKAVEEGLQLKHIQLDNVQKEVDEIRFRRHNKMMKSIAKAQALCQSKSVDFF